MMTGDGTRKMLIETIAETNKPFARLLEALPPDKRRATIDSLYLEACEEASDDDAVRLFNWSRIDAFEEGDGRKPAGHAYRFFIHAGPKMERMPKLRAQLADLVAEWLTDPDQDESAHAFGHLLHMYLSGPECAKSVKDAVRKHIDGKFPAERLLAFIVRNPPDDIKKILAAAWAKNSGCENIVLGAEIASMLEGCISGPSLNAVRQFVANNVVPYDRAIQQALAEFRRELREDEAVTAEYSTTGNTKTVLFRVKMRCLDCRVDAIKVLARRWGSTKSASSGTVEFMLVSGGEHLRSETEKFG